MLVRSVLVTGGNGGLGLGVARYFLEYDSACKVWLGVRDNRLKAQDLCKEFPGRCEMLTLEVTSADSWKLAVDGIFSRHGKLDVLVNNAGMHCDHLLATMPDEAWSSVISSNLDSVFLGCRAAIPLMMREKFGRIINISSLSALLPPVGQTNYAAAKAGVVALTQTLAKEVARAGITVNAVLPGYVETDALADMDEDARKRARATIPMRRFARAEEIAAIVYFLASNAASYVTGSAVKADGGIF